MKKISLLLLFLFVFFNITSAGGQSFQDEMEESNRQFEKWAISLSEFVKDVRFTEEDVQSVISLWEEFSALDGAAVEGEEFVDFATVLKDEAYRSWAKSKDINGDIWLKKTMRIVAVMMRSSIEENSSEEQFDVKSQLQELEDLRPEMSEEAYEEMKGGIEASAAALEAMENVYKHLPVPSDTEKALLKKYKDQLMKIE